MGSDYATPANAGSNWSDQDFGGVSIAGNGLKVESARAGVNCVSLIDIPGVQCDERRKSALISGS